jgi:energy-coupling factor transporter ATP-binding protein EcfA2
LFGFLAGAAVFDEATSALDASTEARIKRALDRLRKERTTFIIAHRLSTVTAAEEILVFDSGRIVERGCFEAPARGTGVFAPRGGRGRPHGTANCRRRPTFAPAATRQLIVSGALNLSATRPARMP